MSFEPADHTNRSASIERERLEIAKRSHPSSPRYSAGSAFNVLPVSNIRFHVRDVFDAEYMIQKTDAILKIKSESDTVLILPSADATAGQLFKIVNFSGHNIYIHAGKTDEILGYDNEKHRLVLDGHTGHHIEMCSLGDKLWLVY